MGSGVAWEMFRFFLGWIKGFCQGLSRTGPKMFQGRFPHNLGMVHRWLNNCEGVIEGWLRFSSGMFQGWFRDR